MKNKIKSIGLMSGTSSDGLSIAYTEIDFDKKKIFIPFFKTYPYDKRLRKEIMMARELPLSDIAGLNYKLGMLWSDMIEKFITENKIKLNGVDVISSHGQTVYHSSKERVTLQIGEPEFISRRFNLPVAYDFRCGDIIAGGEGAPLIPFMDEFLFGERKKPVGLLNIGGISNISVVGKGVKTYGFDIGPGNTLMDWSVVIKTNGRRDYDKNGELASRGRIDFKRINKFMKNKFFKKRPPKSLDREEFGKDFVIKNFDFKKERIEDILATLNYFTAVVISNAIKRFVKENMDELVISGGGVYNRTLVKNISELISPVRVSSISDYGIEPLAKEAAGFALLGAAKILNIPSNCPCVTGAKKRVVLGKLVNG
ncbi:MAG: anhydro-N-acetylmuramic acid kinase [Elusimicrobiales bacterium]|nr:anhydro-N-acetylmuramic acid kinase [Elusimicrobiales bacterium]